MAHLHVAGGQDDVLRAHGVDYVRGRKPMGLQLLGVDIYLHLPLLAAIGERHRRTLHRGQLRANEVRAEVVQLLLGQAGPGEPELQHRHARRTVLNDQGRVGALRILPQRRLRDRGDLRDGLRDVDVGVEIYLDHRDAVQRLRLGMLNVIDRGGQAALELHHDAVAQVAAARVPRSSRPRTRPEYRYSERYRPASAGSPLAPERTAAATAPQMCKVS